MTKRSDAKMINFIVYSLITLAIFAVGTMVLPAKASAQTSGYDTGYTARMAQINKNNNNTAVPSYNPTPTVDSLSPNSGNSGEGAKTVTITGSGFIPSSVARWNGSNRPTTFIDYSHLLINLSASDLSDSNGRFVNVFNPAPEGGYSNSAFFTINGYQNLTSDTGAAAGNGNVSNTSTENNYYSTENNTNGTYPTGEPVTNDDNSRSLASNVIFGSNSFAPSGVIQWIFFAILILFIVILVRKIFGADKRYHSEPLKHA